jgi:hypothetical protein
MVVLVLFSGVLWVGHFQQFLGVVFGFFRVELAHGEAPG